MFPKKPIPDSYWIEFDGLQFERKPDGRLLAGEYPGAKDRNEAEKKIKDFLDAGVTHFIDLTKAGEYQLRPYASLVANSAGERGVKISYQRMAIKDMAIPTPKQMVKILDQIDNSLTQGKTVYVHCFAGIGRTGMVIGCWLVRHGLTGRQAVAKIGALRRGTPKGWRDSPETEEQHQMILAWRDS